VGAVKAIRSLRLWEYETFRTHDILHIVCMATEDDVKANAEYIRLADEFITVEGGSNRNNYANVDLIVKVARRCQADAVWPGWGHASENPKLPAALAYHDIAFLGPSAESMDAVGDKICANILAQSCDVNVIPWSGSGLTVPETSIPEDVLLAATLGDLDQAEESAEKVGFPLMIKASEGGGGKGIRMVTNMEELRTGFVQVQAEVPGSPVFIQQLSTNSRHLEVQVVADKHGNAISLYGRDCSVQRRHQKIIEEAPVTVAPRELCAELERGAVRLAKKVRYSGVGTVEYLYNITTGEYSFLEVNPRLQVEHPVTETITGVNLPAVQLQIAMGIPLNKMPHIRKFYGQTDPNGVTPIDFDTAPQNPPLGHCMAARVTAEDPESGFKPTSGAIHSLHFRSLPGVTGNFSVGLTGGVHQFADSQFGHIFAHKPTRDEAGTLLIQALSELSIRGEIHTNVKYLCSLIEKDQFRADLHSTAWLDGLIAEQDRAQALDDHLAVVCGAVMRAASRHQELESRVVDALTRGVPPEAWMTNLSEHSFELIYKDIRYSLRVTMGSHTLFYIHVNGEAVCEAEVLALRDGGLKVLLGGRAHSVYTEPSKVGLKVHVDGHPCFFPDDFDPTKMSAPGTGKLIRYLVPDGGRAVEGVAYCEVEVMKTVMPLLATSTGLVTHLTQPGAALETGDALCAVEVEDPSSVKVSQPFSGEFTKIESRKLTGALKHDSALVKFTVNTAGIHQLLAGYDFNKTADPVTPLLEVLGTMELALDEFSETKQAVSSRASKAALTELASIEEFMQSAMVTDDGTDVVSVAVKRVRDLIDEHGPDFAPLRSFVDQFEGGLHMNRVRVLTRHLETFLDAEEPFACSASFEDAIMVLRSRYRGDASAVVQYAHAHSRLAQRSALILKFLDEVSANDMIDAPSMLEAVRRLMKLESASQSGYKEVSYRARQIIVVKQDASRKSRRERMKAMSGSNLAMASGGNLEKLAHSRQESLSDFGLASAGSLYGGSMDDLTSLNGSETESSIGAGTPGVPGDRIKRRSVGTLFLDNTNTLARFNSYANLAEEIGMIRGHEEAEHEDDGPSWETLFEAPSETEKFAAIEALFAAAGIDLPATQGAGPHVFDADPAVTFVRLDGGRNLVLFAPSLGHAVSALPEANAEKPEELAFVINYPRLHGREDRDIRDAAQAFVSGQHLAGAISLATSRVAVTLLAIGERPQHFTFARNFANGSLARFASAAPANLPPPSPTSSPLAPEGEFKEVSVARGFWPHMAAQMEVERLANFQVECVGMISSRTHGKRTRNWVNASEYSIGVFLAEEVVPQSRRGAKLPQRDRRVFLRAAVYHKELLLAGVEAPNGGHKRTPSGSVSIDLDSLADHKWTSVHDDSVLADVLGSLELAVGQHGTAWNHVYINMVGTTVEDLPRIEAAIASFIHLTFEDLRRLKVSCVEVRVGGGEVVALNTSGLKFKMTSTVHDTSGPAPRPPLYPLLDTIQRKRMICQNLNSTYAYDFPEIFANVLAEKGGNDEDAPQPGIKHLVELVLELPAGSSHQLVAPGHGKSGVLVEVERAPGMNDVGMVCWRATLVTEEYQNGRDIILVANDITHMSGSFSPKEDAVYRAAFDLAVAEGLPCVYISSNSGARIGLDEAVKAAFRVAWVDATKPSRGFEYLYLTEDDYEMLGTNGRVLADRVVDGETGQVRFALTDVCGGQGVECLQGSGEIAAATSRAYKSTVTMAYVTGRSVGIGAYCSRLCQRVIQHADAPLILTGASALNKVLGREVYTSNAQIGGPKVMANNGVSHMVVPDDVRGVSNILLWLSFVPAKKGAPLPFTLPKGDGFDTIHRPVGFTPANAPHDPREMLHHFFDRGSFMEVMTDWGKSVVTGRARLGGLPIGAVAVETRTSEKTVPADPAFEGAQITEETQAGQVWFPDSAFKTAQAIGDMNREGLPLIIFANWRGFAGGLRDMYGEILKYGAYIVDALREYTQPIFVYIPTNGELRGGAWVVIDSSINPEQMEFYAAQGSKGGVLEPEGVVDIKFRRADLVKVMKRSLPQMQNLGDDDGAEKKLEKELMPTFKQLATHFAALHDTPGVMLHKRAIKEIVPWDKSREFFASRLRMRVAEERVKTLIRALCPEATDEQMASHLSELRETLEEIAATEDEAVVPEEKDEVMRLMKSLGA
jgi:acetyl-CoA carboxylase/biotin carboxylase 1